jgi:hypothetical protein
MWYTSTFPSWADKLKVYATSGGGTLSSGPKKERLSAAYNIGPLALPWANISGGKNFPSTSSGTHKCSVTYLFNSGS